MADNTDSREEWQLRAAAWELLALSFRYPDDALASAVATGEWVAAAREIADTLGLEMPPGWSGGLASPADERTTLHALRREATRLFVGAPEAAASPYEGVWRANAEGVQPLLFVNPHSMDVERFCRACGLGQPESADEPLDHIAAECELLEYLASLCAGISEPIGADAALDAFPGGSPAAAYEQFLAEHARAWIPRFADRVMDESRISFYRAAAGLLKEVAA